jgi:hypothetical protein
MMRIVGVDSLLRRDDINASEYEAGGSWRNSPIVEQIAPP